MTSTSSTARILVRDGMRHRRPTGYGQLSRLIIVSLAARDDLSLFLEASNAPWGDVPRRDEIERLPTARPHQCNVELWIGPPGIALPSTRTVPRVLYTQNALSELRPNWVENLRQVDDVVVPGNFDREVFARHHPSVHVCHQAVDTAIFSAQPERRKEGPSRFCFIFVGSYSYRKGVDVLLRAFCRAFEPGDAELWLFCAGAGERAFNRTLEILQTYQPRAAVKFFTTELSPAWMARILNRADCFVSLSRGEGWCMPLHEALLCGKPAIVSNSTAMAEAFSESEVEFVATRAVEIQGITDEFGASMVAAYGHPGCFLFEPDEDEAVERLRFVKRSYEVALGRARRGADRIRTSYTMDSMGAMMAAITKRRFEESRAAYTGVLSTATERPEHGTLMNK